jgi:arsenate reductase
MTERPIRVLFICLSNQSRSILAEALLRRVGGATFEAFSAGIEPAGVHPLTRRVLEDAGFDHAWAESKSVERYKGQPFDYVITLCDDARLVCPVFPGADQSIHWGYREPAAVDGDEAARLAAFEQVFTQLAERIRQFVLLTARTAPVALA